MESALCPAELISNDPGFRLIETFGFHPGEGLRRGGLHLSRMKASAQSLELPFDDAEARHIMATISGDTPLRCRLTLDVAGKFQLTLADLAPTAPRWRLAVADTRLQAEDPWLRHKTTRRAVYDTARANLPAGVDELLFLNTRGEVCEGTITNVFVELEMDMWVTPPLSSGVLPGVLRQELLMSGQVHEQIVTVEDLRAARSVYVGNSLRGKIHACWDGISGA